MKKFIKKNIFHNVVSLVLKKAEINIFWVILIQGITVAELLRHEAGFANFPTRWQLDFPAIVLFCICLEESVETGSLTKP